jgi:hypothetical protein
MVRVISLLIFGDLISGWAFESVCTPLGLINAARVEMSDEAADDDFLFAIFVVLHVDSFPKL